MNPLSKAAYPLTVHEETQDNLFSGVDPTTVDLPDKVSPMEDAYHQTIDLEPKNASEVLKFSAQSGQSPEFVSGNLDAVKKAVNVPPSQYFADITKKYPETASFLADPRNMAMSKDDIDNFAKTEGLVQNHGFFRDKWNSFTAFIEKYDKPLLPIARLAPAVDPKFYPTLAKVQAPGRGLLQGLEGLTTPSNVALMIATSGLGAAYPTAARVTSGIFAAQMGHGLFQQMMSFKQAFDHSDDVAMLNIGGQMVVSGYMTKETLQHALKSAKAQPSTGPVTDTPKTYSDLGKMAAEAKLPERNADAHGEFLANVVKGSDFENLKVSVSGADTYFQGKGINPDEMWNNLGVLDQAKEARARGGDVSVPFAPWAREFAKTPHYEGLKNDIRFNQESLTTNEVTNLNDSVSAKIDATVEAAKTANPAWEEGLQKVTDQFTRGLVDSKFYTPKDAAVQAEAGAKMIERLAAMTGESDPAAYLQKHPIEIRGGQFVPTEGESFTQSYLHEPYRAIKLKSGEIIEEDPNSPNPDHNEMQIGYGLKDWDIESYGWMVKGEYVKNGLIGKPTYKAIADREAKRKGQTYDQSAAPAEEHKTTWETIPAPELQDPITTSGSQEAKAEFHKRASKLILGPKGENLLAEKMGLKSTTVAGSGAFEGKISPNFITAIQGPKENAFAFARAIQYIYKQKAVPFFQATDSALGDNGKTAFTGLKITFDKALDTATEQKFYDLLRQTLTKDDSYTRIGDNTIAVVNYGEMADTEFLSKLGEALNKNGQELGVKEAGNFRADSTYGPEHDWSKDPSGLALRDQAALAGRPDLQGWLDSRASEFEALRKDWIGEGYANQEKAAALRTAFDKFYTPSGTPEDTAEAKFVRDHIVEVMAAYDEAAKKEVGSTNYSSADLARTMDVPGRPKFESTMSVTRHESSSAVKKIKFAETLARADTKDKPVVITGGISGAGKTTALKNLGHDAEDYASQYDSNLKDAASGKKIIDQALESGRRVEVKYILRDPIKAFEDGVWPRFLTHPEHRIMPIWGHIDNAKSVYAVVQLYDQYKDNPRVKFELIDNNGAAEDAHPTTIDKLREVKYNLSEIEEHLNDFIKKQPINEIFTEKARDVFLGVREGLHSAEGAGAGGPEKAPLFQDAENDPTVNPRASITFQPDKALISLRNADPSSFMHEMGHYWLKNYSDFAKSGKATEKNLADWDILRKWLDVKDDQVDFTREQHEKFAKGFERYLYEGKAPSSSLRPAFNKFRKWLSNIYRDPSALGVDLTPEVRGVMDRILASEEEIRFAEQQAGLGPEARDYANIDLDPKIVAKLDDLRGEAHDAAFQEIFQKQMEEISTENRAKLVDEEAKARAKAEAAVRDSQTQQTIRSVAENFSGDPIKRAQDYWLNKMGDSSILVNNPERARFNQLAESLGYESGDEMAYKIVSERPVAEQVQAQVNDHMKQFAALKDTEKIKAAALAAVHNEKAAELMAREAAVFDDLVDQAKGHIVDVKLRAERAKVEAQAAKLRAQQTIANMPVAEARKFMPYFTAERNAAIRVKKFLMEGNFAEAAKAKREQMLNHALVKEAYGFRQRLEKDLRFVGKFESRGQDLKGLPYGFMRQIDTILSDHGLADPRVEDLQTYLMVAKDMAKLGEFPEEIVHRTGWLQDASGNWRREALSDTVARIQNDYRNIVIPDSVINGAPKDYRQMKVMDFRDLVAAVRAINAVGRGYDRFLDETIKIDRKEAAGQVREFIEKNIGKKYEERRDIGSKTGQGKAGEIVQKISDIPNAAIPSLVNLYRICDFLDAGNPDGLMKNLVYRQLLHAERDKITMETDAIRDMNRIHDEFWKKGELEDFKTDKVHIVSRNRSMTKDEILAFALNQGTETNRQRTRDGFNLTDEQYAEIKSHVTKQMADFAQAVWDHMDTYWSKIVGLQQKVAGETPKKVESSPVKYSFGEYKGGYYPLVYDHTRSADALKNVDARNALYKTMGPAVAHTDHGFTESRLRNYVAPVKFDSNVIYTHLQDVIHDITHRQAIIDASGFLRQRDTRESIINAIGLNGYQTIGQHLKWVASADSEPIHLADRMLRRLRFTGTTAMIGLRPLNFPMDITGNLISAIQDIGPTQMASAIKDFVRNRDVNVQMVEALSPRMAKRASYRDRDLMDMAKRFHGEESVLQHFIFWGASKADEAISFPLWLSVYSKSLDKFGQTKAIDLADEAVTKSVGSGSILDQANIQRGSELKKIFTWWYSWSGMQFNRMWADGKIAGLAYDKGQVGTALMALGTSALYGWVLQGVNENFWREFFRNSQGEDDDKRNTRVMNRMIMQGIGYVPVFRDVAQYELGKITGTHSDLQLPFQDAIKSLADPFGDMIKAGLEDGTLSPRFWESAARGAAFGFGYPQYVNNIAFNFLDNLNGQSEADWRDLVSRKSKP